MKDGVHKTAQLELDSPADWQPVQLKKAGGDMLACAELEDRQAAAFCTRCSGAIVDCGRPASTELQ